MNNLFNKTITIFCKVFFNVSDSVERLPKYSQEYAGKIVLKIHPKGHKMQIRKYKSNGYAEYDIDLHDHDEEEKNYTHDGVHIHEFGYRFKKELNRAVYTRLPGRNLTDEEYEFLQNINYENLIQIQVRYI